MKRGFVLCCAVALVSTFAPGLANAATHVSATTYTTATTWTASGSPYILDGNVSVSSTGSLTIDPGVVVKLNGTFRTLTVDGSLSAVGSSIARIVVTSIQDDSVGGDSGGDGATTGSPGQWYYVKLEGSGTSSFDYVDVRYGGYGFADYTGGSIIAGEGATVIFDHSTSSYSETSGVLVGTGATSSPYPTVTIKHSTLSNNDTGVYINQGAGKIEANNSITSNTRDGVGINLTQAYSGTAPYVRQSQITGNGRYGIYYQPNTGISSSVEATGYSNNIYGNTSGQLYDTMDEYAWLNWESNYWGATGVWDNDSYCMEIDPIHDEHLTYADAIGLPPDGPVSWTRKIYVERRGNEYIPHFCGADDVDAISAASSAFDNSGL